MKNLTTAFANLNFAKKLAFGFGGMALVITLIVVVINRQANVTATVSARVTELRVPTANASLQMLNGINHALAALRGWMLLGKDGFAAERDQAWTEEISPSYEFMREAAKHWTNPANVERFKQIEKLLPEFERIQKEIEGIAQTRDNVPSIKLLFDEAAPQAAIMVTKITEMIDLEANEAATPERKALLGMMADVRGSTGLALANIRAFLLGGDKQFEIAFEKFWATNERRFGDLSNAAHLLTPEQRVAYQEFTGARAIFAPIPPKMLEMRGQPDWNLANHWLATRAAPVGAQLVSLLNEMSADQAVLLSNDGEQVKKELNMLTAAGWAALAIGVGLAALLGFIINRAITRPLGEALAAVNRIADGKLDEVIEVKSTDETGQLLQGMKDMQAKLNEVVEQDIQLIVDAAGSGDLSQRIKLEGKEGFYEKLSIGINDLVDVSDRVVNDTVAVFAAMARGDLTTTIETEYRGSFDQLKQDANATVRKLSEVVEQDIQAIVDSARSGDLNQRIELAGKTGFYEKLSAGVNDLVGAAEQVVTDTIRVLSAMASGDLTKTIETEYDGSFGQLKQDANATVAKLTEVVGEIQSASKSVNTGADEISQGNANLSQRTEEQASSLEETASSMEEMTSTVRQNADNAVEATKLVGAAREQAEQGGEVVGRAVSAMDKINESSRKISDIIGVIDEIAFQTNLLALNASVEAARAGDQGRGFAVVASEVRNLAGRSATAAKEIKELIEDSSGKVDEGSRLVNESGKTLQEIVSRVTDVTTIVGEIAAASQEQSAGIDEVNKAVMQMDELTQQNAALVEEAAAASESMGEQAQGLHQMMTFFTVKGGGTPAAAAMLDVPSNSKRRSAERPQTESKKLDDAGQTDMPAPQIRAVANGADAEWTEF